MSEVGRGQLIKITLEYEIFFSVSKKLNLLGSEFFSGHFIVLE